MKLKPVLISGLLALLSIESYAATARIQFNYTAGARNNKGGVNQIKAAIRNGANRMNAAAKNSKTSANIGIAIIRFVNFNDAAPGRTLRDAYNALSAGTLSGQRADEVARKADLAMVVSNASTGGVLGLARRPGPYSMVGASWIQTGVCAHEIGHNYNAVHSQASPPMRSNGRTYFTLMRTGANTSSLVSYFSNPSVRFRGILTTCCGRNNAKRVRDQRFIRANRR